MKNPKKLSREDAVGLVVGIVQLLYLDSDEHGNFYNPDNPIGADVLGELVTLLAAYDLVPQEPTRF